MKFVVVLFLSWLTQILFGKMSDLSHDNSDTLEYSYYDGISTGMSVFDQTISSFDFDPSGE